jgi:hypothetical protein
MEPAQCFPCATNVLPTRIVWGAERGFRASEQNHLHGRRRVGQFARLAPCLFVVLGVPQAPHTSHQWKNPDQAAGASRRSGEPAASASRIPDNLHRLRWAPRSCRATTWSYALENLRASHPCQATIRGDVCHDPRCCDGRRADKASGPDRGRSAIWRPIPRRLERDPRTANAAHQIIGNSRTGARRAADENSGEISRSRVDRQNLQQRAPLTLPNGGKQALRRRRSSGCEKKKQSRDDTEHILLQAGSCLCE